MYLLIEYERKFVIEEYWWLPSVESILLFDTEEKAIACKRGKEKKEEKYPEKERSYWVIKKRKVIS